MYNVDFFTAANREYKEIWLIRILEASIRGHVKKELVDLVKNLATLYKFNYTQINKKAIERYNTKVTMYFRFQNTCTNFRFRWFYLQWKTSAVVQPVKTFFARISSKGL